MRKLAAAIAIVLGSLVPALTLTANPAAAAGPATFIVLGSSQSALVCGDVAIITATVFDSHGSPVDDGTLVTFSTTLGTIDFTTATAGGAASASLVAPAAGGGVAQVTASTQSGLGVLQQVLYMNVCQPVQVQHGALFSGLLSPAHRIQAQQAAAAAAAPAQPAARVPAVQLPVSLPNTGDGAMTSRRPASATVLGLLGTGVLLILAGSATLTAAVKRRNATNSPM